MRVTLYLSPIGSLLLQFDVSFLPYFINSKTFIPSHHIVLGTQGAVVIIKYFLWQFCSPNSIVNCTSLQCYIACQMSKAGAICSIKTQYFMIIINALALCVAAFETMYI